MDTDVIEKELQELRECLDIILNAIEQDESVSEETREAAKKAWLKY